MDASNPTTLGRPAPASTEAERRAYLDGGLRPLACRSCGTRVLVKKHSIAHTSIQWIGPTSNCPALAAAGPAPEEGCVKLRESIDAAVVEGTLELPREDSG